MLRLKALRQERGLSQRALAEKIGASQKSVDYWEKEKAEPTARFIVALADFFTCSADYLLGREDDYGIINMQMTLSTQEQRLLLANNALSEEQKNMLLSFAEFLSEK